MDTREAQHQHTRDLAESYIETKTNQTNLLDLLSNTVILHHTLPYLPVSAFLRLTATSRTFRDFLLHTPGTFRHLDLTRVKTAQFDVRPIDRGGEVWRNVQVDENLTEDDFYSGPLRGIFQSVRRRGLLNHVQTLVLDGLSVTFELVHDILVDPAFNVRILSLREVKNLNEQKLMQALSTACRRTRPEGTPRLKALYLFGKKDAPLPVVDASAAASATSGHGASISAGWNQKSQHALEESIRGDGDEWYHRRGRMISRSVNERWAGTILDCRDAILFDAVLCTGPRHQNSPAFGKVPTVAAPNNPWAVATFAVGGCASCGSAPEGFTVHGESPSETLPLLSPVPLHASTVRSATCPRNVSSGSSTNSNDRNDRHQFVPRCVDCIRERYCFSCDQWWCESCYQVPSASELAGAQHVHIVDNDGDNDNDNTLVLHEMAALEPPKYQVWMRHCRTCRERERARERQRRLGRAPARIHHHHPPP